VYPRGYTHVPFWRVRVYACVCVCAPTPMRDVRLCAPVCACVCACVCVWARNVRVRVYAGARGGAWGFLMLLVTTQIQKKWKLVVLNRLGF